MKKEDGIKELNQMYEDAKKEIENHKKSLKKTKKS